MKEKKNDFIEPRVCLFWDVRIDNDGLCRKVVILWKGETIFKKVFDPPVKGDNPNLLVHNLFKDYRAEWG